MRPWALISLLPLLLAAAPEDPARVDPVRRVWLHLPETTNHCDDVFDYFPDGGLRILFCHAKEDIQVAQVAALAGVPIWKSGPHARGEGLVFSSQKDFGHYNPEFVTKIPSFALPAEKDSKLRKLTQPTWNTVLQSRARIAWKVHQHLLDPEVRKRELAGYQANMESATPDPSYLERWYDLVDTPDGNVAKTLVAWWLRRWMDGTEDEWTPVLRRSLELYDAAWLAENGGRR